MPDAEGKIRAAILAYPAVTASVVYTMHDMLCAAGRDWGFITTGVPGRQHIAPYVVAAERAEIHTANGMWIRPDYDFGDCPPPDIVCVPDFAVHPDDPCIGRFDTEVQWLRHRHEAGATLASACTAAIMRRRPGYWTGWRRPFTGATRRPWPDTTPACRSIPTRPWSSPARSNGSLWRAGAPAISISSSI